MIRALWLVLLPVAGALAQQPSPPAQPTQAPAEPSVKERVAELRAAVARDLAEVKATIDARRANNEEPPENAVKQSELLTRLDLLYGQILAGLEHKAELQANLEPARRDLESLRASGPSEERPYSVLLLEGVRDRLKGESARGDSLSAAVQSAQEAVQSAKAAFEEKEKARRRAAELFETNKDEASGSRLAAERRLAQLEAQEAAERLRLRELELANYKLEKEVHELRLNFLKEKLALIEREAVFTRDQLNEISVKLDEEEFRLNQALEWAKLNLATADGQWLDARQRLDRSATREPVLVEEVEARRLARQARQREVTQLGQQLEQVVAARKIWERRYRAFNQEASKDEIRTWIEEARVAREQLEREIRLQSMRVSELRREASALDTRSKGVSDAEVLRWLNDQKQHLSELVRLYDNNIDRLESSLALHDKLLAEITEQVQKVSWGERLATLWKGVKGVWGYELTSVQDNPITVRKVVIGIILLFIGTYVARRLTSMLGRRFLPRFGLTEGAAAAIQSLLFYVLVLTVAMLSLRIVNVPLTAFTILGGALAIGIGFGSQNVMNNFISGLIMLVERPVRVGDLIQVEDLAGTVEHIGPRSTRVRSPENVDIVVPNGAFLEKNVINWTLSDDRYRAHIVVGVVYGSPTREVTRLIRKAVDEHGRVLTKPEPIILFSDFGDSALIFEVHFWLRMRRMMDRRMVESDIRYRIDSLFREAGIVIAFPQRDVHLDSVKPIEVRLLDKAQEENGAGGGGEGPAPEQAGHDGG